MKLIEKIKSTKFFMDQDIDAHGSCSLVGNSGCLLDQEYAEMIDNAEHVVRFNNGPVNGFESKVGHKSDFRILNCHFIMNIKNDFYYNQQKERFPELDRYSLYKFRNENLIFKTDPSWQLWRETEILNQAREHNNVYFIDQDMYELGKKLNGGKEATNGFMGLLFSLKYFNDISCFGFSFYSKNTKKHYYEEVKEYNQTAGHDFDTEKKIFQLLDKNNLIKIYGGPNE